MSERTRTQTMTKHLIVRCYPEEHERLERIARAENLSLSSLLRRGITSILDEQTYPPAPAGKRKGKSK